MLYKKCTIRLKQLNTKLQLSIKIKQKMTLQGQNNSKIKSIYRRKRQNKNFQIHDRSFSGLGTGTSIKSGGVKLVLLVPIFPLSEMMPSCKYLKHASTSVDCVLNM